MVKGVKVINPQKLVKDFEEYLVKTKLLNSLHDGYGSTKWIDQLGKNMELACQRSAIENRELTADEINWVTELMMLQSKYGEEVDLFGSYLEEVGQTSIKNGQFFTPMSLAIALARLVGVQNKPGEVITVSDCASGSGRLMIAHALEAKKCKDYTPMDFVYYNQDIDYKSFLCSTLNASLRNLASFNVWGDTLAVKERKIYMTIPMYLGYARWVDVTGSVLIQTSRQLEKQLLGVG